MARRIVTTQSTRSLSESRKKQIVRDIFDNFGDEVTKGAKKNGISVGTYYAWKNKFFKNGRGLVKPGGSKVSKARDPRNFEAVTPQDIQDFELATTVRTTTDLSALVEENNFLWRKVSRLMNGEVR